MSLVARVLPSIVAVAVVLVGLGAPDALSAPPKPWPKDASFDAAPPEAAAPKDAGADAFHLDRTPPDPTPLVTRERWLIDLRWQRGEPRLVGVSRADLDHPAASPRVFGRFAVELFEGPTLIERVRFDFPMLDEPTDPKRIDIQKKLSTRIGVYFPRTTRGTRLELWDRATERRWSLPWPADAPPVVP